MRPTLIRRRSLPRAHALAIALVLAATSCKVVQGVADAPGELVGAASGKSKEPVPIDLEAVQQQGVWFADRIVLEIDAATQIYAQRVNSQAGNEQAVRWRISTAERAYAHATSPYPVAALANLVALSAFEARIHETYFSTQWGEADKPMAATWRRLEQAGLDAAAACLPAEHVASMREVLESWNKSVTDAEALARSGAPAFQDLTPTGDASKDRSGLLGSLGLDPLDSIEPAAREVARARALAERGLFLAQRMARVLSWRIELLTLELTKQPDVQGVLQSIDRTSKSAESVAATAEGLPTRLRTESDALIQRVSEELSAQRAGIVADLERASGPTQALLVQSQQTLDAGTRLAQALDTTTRTVDEFIAHVAPPEPAGAPPKADEPAGKPFDPVEYAALAAQITAGLQELNTAALNLERSLPAVQNSLDEAAARVDRSVERAYGLAVRLVLISIGTLTAAVLIVRAVSRRRGGGSVGGASS